MLAKTTATEIFERLKKFTYFSFMLNAELFTFDSYELKKLLRNSTNKCSLQKYKESIQ